MAKRDRSRKHLRFLITGALLAGPSVGCEEEPIAINEPAPEHSVNEPTPRIDPPPTEPMPTVNPVAVPQEEPPTLNEPANRPPTENPVAEPPAEPNRAIPTEPTMPEPPPETNVGREYPP